MSSHTKIILDFLSLEGLKDSPSTVSTLVAVAVVLFTIIIYQITFATDIPHIKGLPEIPGAVPIFGHLLKLGEDHATVCEKWWRQYNHSVYQISLGNTRAVVVNSFEDCKKMLLGNQNAVIDRPKLYTFHGLISSTQGFTIGSSPWDESCKKKRKAAGTALGRPALRNYYPMFDLESYCILRDIKKDSRNGEIELDVRPYIQRYALNTTLTLCYGIRMDAVYDELLREILHVGSAISLLRSASENYQDYVPILRYVPNNEKNSRSKELRDRRDAYLNLLLDKVRVMIKEGKDKPCISAAILKDEETKLTGVEVSSICLSLVSGGFETIPGTLTSAIGSLSTPEGQIWQDRAYEDIKRHYPDMRDAWANCFVEEKIPYINAIIKEAGRFYTVSAMSLPRKTVTAVNWNGAIIPPKTMILINAQAGNHDVDHFGENASNFNPERWLKSLDPPQEREISGLPHLSFGTGSRACSGQYIASRLLYAALVRLLSSYKIVASDEAPPNTNYVDYNEIKTALVAIPRFFKVKLIPRDTAMTAECLELAEQRTKDHYKEGLVVNGAKVYVVALPTEPIDDRVIELRVLGKSSGGTAVGVACDVSSKKGISDLTARILQQEQSIDLLVSNAGIRRDPAILCDVQSASLDELHASMWSSKDSDWRDTFSVNSTAHYFLSVAFLPLLVAAAQKDRTSGRGSIVITSSCASMHNVTNVDLTSYATSKAATDHLVRLLAAKFSRFYVRVNGINPGFVPSKMNPVGEEGNVFSNLFDKVPARRAGGEEDIASVVIYLASRAGAYVDGISVCVDGGRILLANGQ
ncbi:cytochrome P450 [Annulohypoxylon maeteangense]|uniref:cytochrome P450 n=1 Tax=Annulohypoxylon maeteangense TaxID=1927788 RepID=UPI0020083298|nr:cytochrome P450 [Annulohypoxylon maeteangense]KAI0882878.1 cytochrome P450 [Annulohypoxylon maeteangense]